MVIVIINDIGLLLSLIKGYVRRVGGFFFRVGSYVQGPDPGALGREYLDAVIL